MEVCLNFSDENFKKIEKICNREGLTVKNYCEVAVLKRVFEEK